MADKSRSSDTDKQTSGVTIGNVFGGIWNSIIAGGDVIVQTFTGSDERRAQRNRRAMLQLVKNFWIKGVLEQSLHGAAMIELGLEERADAVERSWDTILQTPDQPIRPLPRGTRIISVFNALNRALLILGTPGSGKTTMLLDLTRDAIARAESDPTQPIPVVFNLSSWAEKRQPIAEWLVDELNTKYNIPKRIARPWVENDDLLLLLDGLDEVKLEHREACVKAINDFRQEHMMPLIVCSRIADYEVLTTQLKLQGAVLLQLLTPQQVDRYLGAAGTELSAVRKALQYDPTLQELAQSPLMLSIMTLAYRDISVEDLQPLDTTEAHRKHLFDAYVEEMFKRRGAKQDYTPRQTINWLTWLAQKMAQHNQSVFLMEALQPSWLSTRIQSWFYVMGSRLIGALIISLAFLITNVVGGSLQDWTSRLPSWLTAGIAIGLIDGLRFEWSGRDSVPDTPRKPGFWRSIINVLVIGLSAALAWGLAAGGTGNLVECLAAGWFPGLSLGLIFGLRGRGQSIKRDVQTVESLSWSWRGFLLPVLVIGVILGSMTFVATSIRRDPGANLWDGNGQLITPLKGHAGQVLSSISPDGTRVVTAGSVDSTVRLWDGADGTLIATLKGPTSLVLSASFNPGGTRILTACGDGTARLWDGADGTLIAILEGHTSPVLSASFNPDGTRILTACDDGTVRLWDGADTTLSVTLQGHTGSVRAVSFNPAGMQIVTASDDGTARLWDGAGGTLIATLKGHMGSVRAASFNLAGTRVVTASDDGTARLWDGADGTLIATLKGPTSLVLSASFNPDGTRILTTSDDGTVRLWEGADGTLIATLQGHMGPVRAVSFNPAGTRIVTASDDGTARLWDGADGTLIVTLKGHMGPVRAASFNPAGTRIVTASDDGTARLWDGTDGTLIAILEGHTNPVYSASFNSDGTRIVTTSSTMDTRPLSVLWLAFGLVLGLFNGLRSNIRESKTSPNQGIWLSVRNAVVVGLIFVLIALLIVAVMFILTDVLFGLISHWVLFTLFLFSLLGLLALCVVSSALWYGGLDVIQHLILRLILCLKGHMPWSYARFLDYATERIFLRKVGGGYIFVHRLLMEHFAVMNTEEAT